MEERKSGLRGVWVIMGLLLVNAVVADFLLWKTLSKEEEVLVQVKDDGEGFSEVELSNLVQNEVKRQVSNIEVAQASTPVTAPSPTPTATPAPTPTSAPVYKVTTMTTTKSSFEEFINLTSGSSQGGEWSRLGESQWLDTSLYGELVSATWQGWLAGENPGSVTHARLYDATNHRVVDGSEVEVTGTGGSFYSSNLSIWRGQNQYFVEIKNGAGGTVAISGARMKLVLQ